MDTKTMTTSEKNSQIALVASAVLTVIFYYFVLRPIANIFNLSIWWKIGIAFLTFFMGVGAASHSLNTASAMKNMADKQSRK
ncbi:MAG: hypothetical protein A2730_03950 [Candidatus Staskawiczbacteria bacterium RIFCSPHIGHO2_01_FULL_39_25]|uniref:Uncharacterized protein n=1 Tax=Candidatus Staskawiczbacteria bacterium RIFCSPHIGHO2_01_FULL_39_25 TaxID=1802202 RepID=A0A1G2HQ79_9BACT|nr:hypothetical protein [Candidatus Woesearchaeota archaeon]OGZ64400.1 MAG: hypothetical protein A2730_03950 [Candidatus Staskawiczbacteria bacterium RIFCSPHIGHO2_01_FULL_39_25]